MKDFDKDFFEWLDKKYPMEGHNDWLFEDLPKSAQFGLVQEFADTKGYYIYISFDAYLDGVNKLWQILKYNPKSTFDCWDNVSTGAYGDNGEYTLQEAQDKAIEKLKELYNQKQ